MRVHKSCCIISLMMVAVTILMAFVSFSIAGDLTPKQRLGKLLYFDKSLSDRDGQSCGSCHLPGAGFADMNRKLPVSAGVVKGMYGGRNAPSAAYAAFSPAFDMNSFVGGQFWDGRASSLEDQAKGPFLNPVEMHNADKLDVVLDVQSASYWDLFEEVFAGRNLADVDVIYDCVAEAIAEYERSSEVCSFSSKYDKVLAGKARLSPLEAQGLALFEGKGNCSKCHPAQSQDGGKTPPLFTDFAYDNLGIPANPTVHALTGSSAVDEGLGGRSDIKALDPLGLQLGKFKVPTLRNVAKTAPYGHNGYFQTLESIIEFYNTAGTPGLWPEPEVIENVNRIELGDLKLTPDEIKALAAFLATLTDTYK